MDRRKFLASVLAAAGAAAVGGFAQAAEAAPQQEFDTLIAGLQPDADLPAEGAQDAQWVTRCYWTRNRWGQRVRVCRRVPVRRRRRCWWTYDRWGRRVRICN